MIIAIDPGLKGAIVLYEPITAKVAAWYFMPTEAKAYGTGQQVSASGFDTMLDSWAKRGVQRALIERVAARPGQGVSGMFSFGRSLGVLEGVIAT